MKEPVALYTLLKKTGAYKALWNAQQHLPEKSIKKTHIALTKAKTEV